MKNILSSLKNKLFKTPTVYPLALLLISLYLIVVNHIPGTYLSGWDTLHPEFNFGLNFQRLIFGVFRDNQGLGAVAAHAHMSDLPRTFIIFLFSFFLQSNLLRFTYIALCLPIGTLGTYFFIKNVIFRKAEHNFREAGSFLGALFYLLNLGTLQHFYVPYEMFSTQFAFLPWLFLTVVNYLNSPSKKNLFYFASVNLLATPMAYASTLWFAYFAGLILFLIPLFKQNIKKIITLVVITLTINSFWILPNIYFLTSGNAANIPNAKINELFSEEAFAYNKSFGNIKDTLIFKNFLFEWKVYRNNKFGFLLENWRGYIDQPNILLIGYVFAGIYLAGLIYGISKKNRYIIALLGPGIFAFVFLINENPPFTPIFVFLREHSNIFKEALRFPFTKFSLLLIFTCSCYFAFGIDFFYRLFAKLHSKIAGYSIILIIVFLLIVYMLPAFKGNLISPLMQVKIPKEYFQTFDWFNNQEDGRVAMLPIHSFWGWIYYNWGFQGSGFLTFGIKQPLLDRDFDRWNPSNEEYYREMSYAVYSRNLDFLEIVLNKYHIKYLLLDDNVIPANESVGKAVLFSNEIKSLFDQSSKIHLAKEFGNIQIYKYDGKQQATGFITTPSNFTQIQGSIGPKDKDYQYQTFGDYISNSQKTPDIKNYYFPFSFFVNNQNLLNSSIISYENNSLILKTANLPSPATLPISDYLNRQIQIPANISLSDSANVINGQIQLALPFASNPIRSNDKLNFKLSTKDITNLIVNLDNQQTIDFGNIQFLNSTGLKNVLLSTQVANDFTFYSDFKNLPFNISNFAHNISLCGNPDFSQSFSSRILENGSGVTLTSKKAQVCFETPLKNIIQTSDINGLKSLINIKFEVESTDNLLGHYCVFDNLSSHCIKELQNIETNKLISDFFPVDKYQLSNLRIVFYAENPDTILKSISYKNLSFSISNPFATYLITPDDLKKAVAGKSLNLNKDSKIIIDTSTSSNKIDLTEEHKAKTCSDIIPEIFTRSIDENGVLTYSSKNGSSCDSFSLPNLTHNNSYLLLIKSRNQQGLPIRVCISNYLTKRCDVYTDLPINNNFSYSALVIPPTNDGGIGYGVNLDNISIGKKISTNKISEMLMINFPYDFITQMVFTDNKQYDTSLLKTNSVSILNPSLVSLNYTNNSNYPSLLIFNQAFDNGWFVLNKKHVLVNGWANGWIIQPRDSGSLLIIYLPELLEIFGLILTISLIIFFFFKIIFNRSFNTFFKSNL